MTGSAQTAYSTLDDFDWSMRMVLSSDKISGLRKPLLMLKLQTLTADNKQEESLVEMDADELSKLLKSLKAAQKIAHM